jgi:TnpA family transposase
MFPIKFFEKIAPEDFLTRLEHIWGEATTACASDAKKFGAWDQNLMTEWHIRYRGPGIMIYWHVERGSTCIFSQLKRPSSSEVAAMIHGLLNHNTEMEVNRNYVDTHGQSVIAFAFCHLLGFQLLPRLKNIYKQRLSRPAHGQPEDYPNLQPIMTRPIQWDWINKQYDEMIKYATALRLGTADTETILRRFAKGPILHPTYRALVELGKAVKTIFLCHYLHNLSLRHEIYEGLQVVENWNSVNGYEWTSAPNGNNLHRNVIFRDGPERVKQIVPFSAFDSDKPEALWEFLASYEEKTGGRVLAIPHNPNISNGVMFAVTMSDGKPLTREYAEKRALWEPLLEVTQTKGDSEAHPLLSPEDEFADFETWDFGNAGAPMTPKQDDMLQYEYARSALKWGLKHKENLGVNPFKFGMVGGTDNHVSLSTSREENYFGKLPNLLPGPERTQEAMVMKADGTPAVVSWETGASGLTGVWARENTRESLFDAMARKEVYATSGSRIMVRVFAGWDFKADEVERPNFAEQDYKRGVPMGGDLTTAPAGKVPSFMVRALRDPDGANLDRVQIIKGWMDNKGDLHEKVYDVAASDGRKINVDGRCKTPVGNTVDVPNASYTNSIGDALLMGYWKDPQFDAKQSAFYYVRVIEIPTPRWTAYDAKRFGITMPKEIRMTVKDRAYTSPIWYTP